MNLKWTRSSFAFLLLAALAACTQNFSTRQVKATIPYAVAVGFSDWIEERRTEDNIPGVAVTIVQGKDILLIKGFGDRDVENNLPVTTDTLFHIGSTHKSMTALLIATLVDDGTVDWDTPAIDIDPDFELENEYSTESVTLRHLLSMRSGISEEAEDDFDVDNASAEDLFDYIAEVELLGEPGEVFSYSNVASSITGYLAVLAVDPESKDLYKGYADLLQERVLDPVGMENSTIYTAEARQDPNYSRSYIINNGDWIEAESYDLENDPLAPSGSLKASIIDMAKYIIMQVNRGVADDGTRVVSEENVLATWEPEWDDYAMGWQTDEYKGTELIYHEGAYDNFASIIGVIPEYNIGFVVLTNCEEASVSLLEDTPSQIIDLLLE
mgnify:CR=1 FL=1